MGAWADEMTFTFKDTGRNGDGGNPVTEIADIFATGGENVELITSSPSVYNGGLGKGIRLGTEAASGQLTFNLKSYIRPSKLTFKALQYSESEKSIDVGVKGNVKEFTDLTPTIQEYEIDYDASTPIKYIFIEGPKRVYITEMTITYTPAEAPVAANIAELNKFYASTEFQFTGEVIVVAKPNEKYTYIKDNTGSSLIFDGSQSKCTNLKVGSTVEANWQGSVNIYYNLFEAEPKAALSEKPGDINIVTYPSASAADMTAANMNKVVVLKGVTYTKGSGKNLTITQNGTEIAGFNQFQIDIADPVEGKKYDIIGAISRYKDKIQFQPITIEAGAEDVVVTPAEGSDIAQAVEAATEGKKIKDIYVYLKPGKKFTISKSIVAPAAFIIMGAEEGDNPSSIDNTTAMAEIDASALTGPMVLMSTDPAIAPNAYGFYPLEDAGFVNVKVTGLKQQLFYANKMKYLINGFHIAFCNIQMVGGNKTLIDCDGGGVIADFDISKNTIWANPAHSGQFYSSQSGQKATEAGLAEQVINFERNTFYNISYGKNICTHRQANQTWLKYDIKNTVFINTGKSGQAIKGLNGGSGGANPTWEISGNAFNFDGADTSANEETGDADHTGDETPGQNETVQNSVAGVFVFNDAAKGDFNGIFKGKAAEAPAKYPGDPRWTYTYEAPVMIYIIGDMNNWDRTALTEMAFNETTQAYEYEYAPNTTAYFAIATKQLTEEEANADEDWSNFNNNYRYAIGEGNINATLNEAVALQKVNGTIVLKPVKESTSYKISVAKDLSTITITGEAAPEPEATYTVVGAFYYGDPTNEVAIFGTVWDVSNTANDLEKQTDGTYKKVYENVTFEHDGNITFKIAENHSWDVNYGWTPSADNPNGNAEYYVAAPATNATMTITFDPNGATPEDKVKISVEGIPTGINGIDANAEEANAPIYNLAGQKVTKSYKGVVIQNGKKYMQK